MAKKGVTMGLAEEKMALRLFPVVKFPSELDLLFSDISLGFCTFRSGP